MIAPVGIGAGVGKGRLGLEVCDAAGVTVGLKFGVVAGRDLGLPVADGTGAGVALGFDFGGDINRGAILRPAITMRINATVE